MDKENQWSEINKDVADIAKKVKSKIDEEDLVEDLKDSFKSSTKSSSSILDLTFFAMSVTSLLISDHWFSLSILKVYIYKSLDLSLKLKFGFLVNLCFAHLAGAISRKNGGRKGLEYFSKYKLKFNSADLNFVSLIP